MRRGQHFYHVGLAASTKGKGRGRLFPYLLNQGLGIPQVPFTVFARAFALGGYSSGFNPAAQTF